MIGKSVHSKHFSWNDRTNWTYFLSEEWILFIVIKLLLFCFQWRRKEWHEENGGVGAPPDSWWFVLRWLMCLDFSVVWVPDVGVLARCGSDARSDSSVALHMTTAMVRNGERWLRVLQTVCQCVCIKWLSYLNNESIDWNWFCVWIRFMTRIIVKQTNHFSPSDKTMLILGQN